MNEYKITYTSERAVAGGEGTFTMSVIDRTASAAKKFFNSDAKECGRVFQSIELLRTDAPATKRNEREILEDIRQMVADLGPKSYVAAAFDGCFEVAESNIECDFGDSMKGRLEIAEKEVVELRKKLKTAELNERDLRSAIKKAKEDSSKTITALQIRQLSDEDLETVITILRDRAGEAEELAEKTAAEIVRLADDPVSPEFRRAVAMNRNHSTYAKSIRELLGRVDAIRAANHAGA